MALTDNQREILVGEAKSWIRTPYRGGACLKRLGVDCGQFIYGVYRNCNLLPLLTCQLTTTFTCACIAPSQFWKSWWSHTSVRYRSKRSSRGLRDFQDTDAVCGANTGLRPCCDCD